MARHPVRIGGDRQPALDLVSYGRRGPSRPERFAPEQVDQIARTVRRTPEVMVKVSGGGNSLGAVAAHFMYITRKGTLQLETDDGERRTGSGVARNLVDDWDLEIDLAIDRWDRMVGGRRASTAKLVHNIVLSMPAGTSPQKLLAASREFAREEFALQHRYALVLHTDQDHPHVHLVISTHKREGGRLNVRKVDLRRWREQFARQLRHQVLRQMRRPPRSAADSLTTQGTAPIGRPSVVLHVPKEPTITVERWSARVSGRSSTRLSASRAIGSRRVVRCMRKACESSLGRSSNFARGCESPSHATSARPRERGPGKIDRQGSWNC